MERFMSGLTGAGIGFMIFLSSYLFASQSTANSLGQADTIYIAAIALGAVLIYLMPLIFWIIIPFADRFRS